MDFDDLLSDALFADQSQAFTRLRNGQSKLVHYTSAENGLRLLQGGTFWLRNVKCMNDYSEVSHGIDMLVRVLRKDNDKLLNSLRTALDACSPGCSQIAFDAFDHWARSLPFEVYVGCLAEHDPEDTVGLLSMWRAYGGPQGGVALMFNPHPMLQDTDELKAFTVPVFYLHEEEFESKLTLKIQKLISASALAQDIAPDSLANIVVRYLIAEAISMKHSAFREEREFRIVYAPLIEASKHITAENVSIRGVPQIVYKIPLEDSPEKGLFKADIPNLIARVIIGPTEFMMPVWSAFVSELERSGVQHAEQRVVFSGIPLRM
jgi:hypothetical protein